MSTREEQLEYIIMSLNEGQTILIENIKQLKAQLEEEKQKTRNALILLEEMEQRELDRMDGYND